MRPLESWHYIYDGSANMNIKTTKNIGTETKRMNALLLEEIPD